MGSEERFKLTLFTRDEKSNSIGPRSKPEKISKRPLLLRHLLRRKAKEEKSRWDTKNR